MMFSVFLALRGGFIDKKAIWFMISYAVIFFLKFMIFSATLINIKEDLALFKFVLSFLLSCTSDLITFLIYTFIFEMKEVVIMILSSDEKDFLNRMIANRRLKIFIYISFFFDRVILQAIKILLYDEY